MASSRVPLVGFITCSPEKLPFYFPTVQEPDFLPVEPPFTPDDQLAVDCLRRLGHRVEPVVWGEDPLKLSRFDGLVMRSPWDYMDSEQSRERFMSWLGELQQNDVPVHNSPALMRWLGDKRYLADFQSAGIPIVPTCFVDAGADLPSLRFPCVLKPNVSGGGQGLFYLESAEDLTSEIERAVRRSAYLVQDFIPEIRQAGEWSLVYLDGNYSHAVHKLPGPDSILVHAEQGGSLEFCKPPSEVRRLGDLVSDRLGRTFKESTRNAIEVPLYLRVDVIPTAGGPLLSECEGVEPELFFRVRPGSEEEFARALLQRLGKSFTADD